METLLTCKLFMLLCIASVHQCKKLGKDDSTLTKSSSDTKAERNPLILTPYIESGRLEEGRRKAEVTSLSNIESYSGYFTVNTTYNSNLFFWFFPAAINPAKAPVLLWLQGGPTASSLFGLFVENGPFKITRDNRLVKRRYPLTRKHSVIYIDSPVGTGYSFTDEGGYVNSFVATASDVYTALTQFFLLFPKYAKRDFYLTGESYAGKYIPVLATKIIRENKGSPRVKMNLKGVAIGNPTMDPITFLLFGEFLYSIGLIDERERNHFQNQERIAKEAIRQKNWVKASRIIDTLFRGDFSNTTYFSTVTGYSNYYNFLLSEEPVDWGYYEKFVIQPHVRRALHVGDTVFHGGLGSRKAKNYFREDIPKSALAWFVKLLDAVPRYRVLIFSGHLDIRVPTIATEKMLRTMRWHGSKQYRRSAKQKWYIKKQLVGYVRKAKNLKFLIIRNAGHIVPYDQSRVAYNMINRFISGKRLG